MSLIKRGRIIELWAEENLQFFELVEGDQRTVLSIPIGDRQFSTIQRGDLVEVQANTSLEVQRIRRVGGPAQGQWSPLTDGMRWRRSLSGPSRMKRLYQRQEILGAIRTDLYSQGFLEVETPLWVKGTCPDVHIDSVNVEGAKDSGYLVSSTEYQIKRLMVGGFEKVFTLTKNFRAGDRGKFHSSEFTMLEWARAYGSLDQPGLERRSLPVLDEIEDDAERFIQGAFLKLYPNVPEALRFGGCEIDLLGKRWERLTVREALEKHLGLKNLGDFSMDALCRSCREADLELPSSILQDQHWVVSYLLDQLQPHLGKKVPTFLREWPAFMTSSAQLSEKDPYVAERSELYIAGIEISDGFPFLRDPVLQREWFARENHRRQSEGKSPVVLDELYLQALEEGIPEGAGMALGVDRLVMVLTGASSLGEVQAFGWEEI